MRSQLAAFALGVSALAVCALTGASADEVSLVDAVRDGDRDAASALIAGGADVNAAAPDGATPLLWAVHRGDAELVSDLIAAGADVSVANDYGATPMSEAAAAGDAAVIAELLDAGADVESANAEGQTALMAVARTGRVDAAELLLDHGADVNAIESWGGQSALMWAAAQRQPEMVRMLVARGADVDARGKPRDWGRRITSESRIKDLNYGGFTPLLYAAREGCTECARALVEGGADINLITPDGVTPLLMAALNIHYDTVAYLADAGADVNRWDLWGRSSLYEVVDTNTTPHGGRPDLPSDDSITGLALMEKLLEKGANVNVQLKLFPPYRAVGPDRGGDSVLTIGATPLMRAVKGGDLEAVELLLAHEPLVDLPNVSGVTPLMVAAGAAYRGADTRGRFMSEQQGIASARLLLAAGAEIDARDDQGRTALHGAVQRGWGETARFLLENGADIDAKDDRGLTAYDLAAGNGGGGGFGPPPEPKPEIAAMLEEHGATVTADPPEDAG